MVFEYILKKHNLDPATDMNIDQSIDFGSTAAAFSGGQGDFTVEFEPGASTLEKEGKGYVVASLGVDSGYVPYTAYSAKQSYLNAHPEIIQGFTNALQKGMDYVQSHTPAEIAKVIAPQFAETDLEDITTDIRMIVIGNVFEWCLKSGNADFEGNMQRSLETYLNGLF